MDSLGTFIFQTPPLALLSSSLYANQQQTLHKPILNSFNCCEHMHAFILNLNLPKWFSFSPHQMITTSQGQAGDTGYIVVNSPKVLLQCQGEKRKQVILLNHLLAQGVQTAGLVNISHLLWCKKSLPKVFSLLVLTT